jgi:aspartyl-tRNA(Asn)/glutamyl-tRNA(Gln) amidotransferase subunit B
VHPPGGAHRHGHRRADQQWSRFDRKNYFYADLPQGYQISQLYHPLVGEGSIEIALDEKNPEAGTKVIGVERIHVEQDAGKLMHDQHPTMSYVDLNRSGVALMEIVSRPDMRSRRGRGLPHQAAPDPALCRLVRRQHGSGLDARRRQRLGAPPGEEFGTRTETKNVNSVRFVMAAIEHEASRQVDVLEAGGKIVQETRLFDPGTGTTRSMRSKEDAHDYRYFPDPDLLPLELTMPSSRNAAPACPNCPTPSARYTETLGLSAYNAAC